MTNSNRAVPQTTQNVDGRPATAIESAIKVFSRATLKSFFLLGLSMTTATALAQFSGGLQGTVQDSTGAELPDAVVNLTNVATNVTQSARTDASGVYRFASLAPGSYTVSVEMKGF